MGYGESRINEGPTLRALFDPADLIPWSAIVRIAVVVIRVPIVLVISGRIAELIPLRTLLTSIGIRISLA